MASKSAPLVNKTKHCRLSTYSRSASSAKWTKNCGPCTAEPVEGEQGVEEDSGLSELRLDDSLDILSQQDDSVNLEANCQGIELIQRVTVTCEC
jgi:hypothetical protein